MKRMIISLLLTVLMLAGMMSVHAAPAEVTVKVCASKTEVQVGDTVEYTVLATGSGVVAMQFELRFPEGLSYVPNSGATPANLAQKLGVPAADWTEVSKMFTFYNDVGITFHQGTEILRFSCVAEKEGQWSVELYELLPFDGDFEEFVPKLQVQSVLVGNHKDPIEPPVTEPTDPPVIIETTPAVTVPEITEAPTELEDPGENTEPPLPQELPEQIQDVDQPEMGEIEDPQEEKEPVQNRPAEQETTKNSKLWLAILIAVPLVAGVVIIFILRKKKSA